MFTPVDEKAISEDCTCTNVRCTAQSHYRFKGSKRKCEEDPSCPSEEEGQTIDSQETWSQDCDDDKWEDDFWMEPPCRDCEFYRNMYYRNELYSLSEAPLRKKVNENTLRDWEAHVERCHSE